MNEIIHILAVSIGSIIVLFILTKLMGYRQMSQLSMFDYINGITIGSIEMCIRDRATSHSLYYSLFLMTLSIRP